MNFKSKFKLEFEIETDSENMPEVLEIIRNNIEKELNERIKDRTEIMCSARIEKPVAQIGEVEDKGKISDGYHTFDELYYHRMILFSVICNHHKDIAWKSWKHADGTMFDDYFIVGITTPKGNYTYHYQKQYWDMFDVKELEFAPEWDGHQPKDIDRLLSIPNSADVAEIEQLRT